MKKILIVEDEKILRDAYKEILTQEGFAVTGTGDGKQALAKLATTKPDLILLDILMPEMDGVAFLRAARLPKNYPHTKVIAFSNLSDQQKLEDMLELGVTDNVLKSSLSPKQLVELIRRLLT